jgi:hypothetical protein
VENPVEKRQPQALIAHEFEEISGLHHRSAAVTGATIIL